MSQDTALHVRLWPQGDEEDPVEHTVKYVSFVNDGTFGPPPLVAPKDGNPPLAALDEEVLYVNTSRVAAFTITRQDF